MDGQTEGQMDGGYQVHYLPRFAVDNNCDKISQLFMNISVVMSLCISIE